MFGPQERAAGQRHPAGADRQHRRPAAARPDGRPTWAARHEPFFLNADPARPDFKVGDLEAAGRPDRVPPRRPPQAARTSSTTCSAAPRRATTPTHDTAYERAFRLLTSPETKKAFDLTDETDTLRDRYGRNTFGQSCLMARRLIERGVRYVTVNHFDTVFNLTCWDMHADGGGLNNTYLDYERHLCPQFDRALHRADRGPGAARPAARKRSSRC